jgi:hypothetical protein
VNLVRMLGKKKEDEECLKIIIIVCLNFSNSEYQQ